jgi:hypothetical protein
VLDDTQPDAYDVLVAGDLVYYSTTDYALRMLRYDGTGAQTFAPSWPTYSLAADSTNLYITDYYQEIHEMPLGGGNLGVLAQLASCQQTGSGGIAAYGGNVYWTIYATGVSSISASSVTQMPTPVAGAGTTLPNDESGPIAINDSDYLYWGSNGTISRLAVSTIGSASAQVEAFTTTTNYVVALALDTDNVYWISSDGDLDSKPKNAPMAQNNHIYYEAMAGASDAPVSLAVDDSYVYWLAGDGTVKKAAKGGVQVINVSAAPPAGGPNFLAVDCGAVYWTVTGPPIDGGNANGILYRAAKGP